MASLPTILGHLEQSKTLAAVSSVATLKTFRCLECLTVLIGRTTFLRHRLTHVIARLFKCNDCGLRFVSQVHLNQHHTSHKDTLPHQCDSCTASYAGQSGLKKHQNMHADQSGESYSSFVICVQCNFIFASEAILKRHISARHTEKLNFECGVCRAQFNTNSQVEQHLELHGKLRKTRVHQRNKYNDSNTGWNTEKMLNIECDICYQPFTCMSSVRLHLRNIHRKVYCTVCCTFVDKKCARKNRKKAKTVCSECRGKKNKKPKLNKVATESAVWSLPPNPSVQQLVKELLLQLVDEELLISQGMVDKPIDKQLETIVELCGEKIPRNKEASIEDWLRENIKHLITLSVGEEAVRILLRFKSVEAIILCLLESQYKAMRCVFR